MLLYACRVCGRWQDVSITQAVQKALEPLNKWAAEQQGMSYQPQQEWACPAGHGLMTQVLPADRIFVRVTERAKRESTDLGGAAQKEDAT